jgi:hypothetical protein
MTVAALCATNTEYLISQTSKASQQSHRPVFVSVERLALLCLDWNAVNPRGNRPDANATLNISPQQMARAFACDAYIDGVNDESLESKFEANYKPLPSELNYKKALIEAFLRYASSHPEELSLAASTVLGRVQHALAIQQTPAR